jgi:hypothetical protein
MANENSRMYVMVAIKPGKEQDFADEIARLGLIRDPKVEKIDFVHGSFDFIITFCGLADDIDGRILEIRLLPYVLRTETLIPFKLFKWEERVMKQNKIDLKKKRK